MSGTVQLIGAEEVQRAGSAMSSAADRIAQAASSLDHTLAHRLEMHERWMDDWLSRFEACVERLEAAARTERPECEGGEHAWLYGVDRRSCSTCHVTQIAEDGAWVSA